MYIKNKRKQDNFIFSMIHFSSGYGKCEHYEEIILYLENAQQCMRLFPIPEEGFAFLHLPYRNITITKCHNQSKYHNHLH